MKRKLIVLAALSVALVTVNNARVRVSQSVQVASWRIIWFWPFPILPVPLPVQGTNTQTA